MAQSCSANSLNLKYLRSPAVRLDNKCQFSCVCSEFCFMTFWLQPQRTSSSKWGSCISCSSQTCFAVILNFIQGRMETSSYCNVAAYDWILNQVQDDGYREPRLEEGVLVNQEGYVWTMPTYSSNRFADEPYKLTSSKRTTILKKKRNFAFKRM